MSEVEIKAKAGVSEAFEAMSSIEGSEDVLQFVSWYAGAMVGDGDGDGVDGGMLVSFGVVVVFGVLGGGNVLAGCTVGTTLWGCLVGTDVVRIASAVFAGFMVVVFVDLGYLYLLTSWTGCKGVLEGCGDEVVQGLFFNGDHGTWLEVSGGDGDVTAVGQALEVLGTTSDGSAQVSTPGQAGYVFGEQLEFLKLGDNALELG